MMGRLLSTLILLIGTCGLIPLQGQILVNYDPELSLEAGKNWYSSSEVAKVVVDVGEFPLANLLVRVPAKTSVFVGLKLWLFSDIDTTFIIPLREIKEKFPAEGNLREIAVYQQGIKLEEVSFQKGLFRKVPERPSVQEPSSLASSRTKSPVEDFFFMAVIIVLFLIALFKLIYPAVLSFIVHPVLVFSTEDFSDTGSVTKFFTEEVLFFLVIFNMLGMLIVIISVHFLKVPIFDQLFGGDLNHLFLIWLFGTGLLLIASLLKFIWLKLCAVIFGISKIEFIHFFYMLRIAAVLFFGIYVSLIVGFTNDVLPMPLLMNFLLFGFFVGYILGALMFFSILAKKVSFKNYHLFSYLCTAELVPFLVLSKLIIG